MLEIDYHAPFTVLGAGFSPPITLTAPRMRRRHGRAAIFIIELAPRRAAEQCRRQPKPRMQMTLSGSAQRRSYCQYYQAYFATTTPRQFQAVPHYASMPRCSLLDDTMPLRQAITYYARSAPRSRACSQISSTLDAAFACHDIISKQRELRA